MMVANGTYSPGIALLLIMDECKRLGIKWPEVAV